MVYTIFFGALMGNHPRHMSAHYFLITLSKIQFWVQKFSFKLMPADQDKAYSHF